MGFYSKFDAKFFGGRLPGGAPVPTPKQEAGVMTVTAKEAAAIGSSLPKSAIIVKRDISPSQAIAMSRVSSSVRSKQLSGDIAAQAASARAAASVAAQAARVEKARVVEIKRVEVDQKKIIEEIQKAKQFQQTHFTRTDLAPVPTSTFELRDKPYYEKRVIDTIRDPKTGRDIPYTQLVYIDPRGIGVQKEKILSPEERSTFEKERAEVIIPEEKGRIGVIVGGVTDFYGRAERRTSEVLTKPIGEGVGIISGKLGGPTTLAEATANIKESTELLTKAGVSPIIAKGGELISGFGIGATEQILTKPLATVATYGAGAAVGATVKGASLIIPATKVGGIIGKGAPVVLGGFYAATVVPQVVSAGSFLEAGKVLGGEAVTATAFSAGFVKGGKIITTAQDLYITRGRTQEVTTDLILPDVLSGKTRFLESKAYGFKGGTVAEKQAFDIKIFESPGKAGDGKTAFHVTSNKFWDDIGFTTRPDAPRVGDLPGTYTAPSLSIQFAGLGEKQTYKLFGSGIEKASRPAVARIKTDFTLDPKSTEAAFVRGIKPEIEAIIPGVKEFVKVSGETFVKVEGRRLPIDYFEPAKGKGIIPGEVKVTGKPTAPSSGSSYLDLKPTPIYTPVSLGSSAALSYSRPSIKISTTYVSSGKYSGSSYTPSTSSFVSSGSPGKPSGSPSGSPGYNGSGSIIKGYSSPKGYSPSKVISYSRPFSPGRPIVTKDKISVPKLRFKPVKQKKKKKGLFDVQVRRGGKFTSIGQVTTLGKAVSLGKQRVSTTLAATYKISGVNDLKVQTPKGFRKKVTKEGTLFIEKRARRLSVGTEKSEILRAKRRKR